jgi:hypothetical protein
VKTETTSWERVFRVFADMLSDEQLEKLRRAVAEDDPRLIQGATLTPPPLMCVQDWPVEAACLIAFPGWTDESSTVGECEEFFARTCFEIDKAVGIPAGCRFLINWFDDTPRDRMRAELLPEIDAALE